MSDHREIEELYAEFWGSVDVCRSDAEARLRALIAAERADAVREAAIDRVEPTCYVVEWGPHELHFDTEAEVIAFAREQGAGEVTCRPRWLVRPDGSAV